jgi:hypothetical protein
MHYFHVSRRKSKEPKEVCRIDEDLPCLIEARLAAEFAPYSCGLWKIAGIDVVPDLVPFRRG